MATNYIEFPVELYAKLLEKFPEQYQEKLRMYTGQELFYIHRICKYEAKREEDGSFTATDWKVLGLKAKVYTWLRDTKDSVRPLPGNYITLACRSWTKAMVVWIDEQNKEAAEEYDLTVAV